MNEQQSSKSKLSGKFNPSYKDTSGIINGTLTAKPTKEIKYRKEVKTKPQEGKMKKLFSTGMGTEVYATQ